MEQGTKNILNTFEGGIFTDTIPRFAPKNTYNWAWNAVNKTDEAKNFGLANERKLKEISSFDKIIGGVYVESLSKMLIFNYGGGLELWLVDTENNFEKEFVCSDQEFGCDWNGGGCQWINPTIKIMQPCDEPIVYFSSGCDYYKVNLAEMLDEKRKSGLKECIVGGEDTPRQCGYDCSYFKLMNCVCSPRLLTVPVDGGGELSSGAYQFAVQLEDNAGNTTNWSWVDNPIFIGSVNNIPGEFSNASIQLHIHSLDCKYDKLRIAVVKDQADTAEIVATRNFNNQSIAFDYIGQKGRTIPIEEILIKKRQYIRGQELTQKDNRLWLYKTTPDNNLNMQRRVFDEVDFSFIEIESSARDTERLNLPTFERGEYYLPAIVYHFCDGTNSPGFLLYPRGDADGASSSDSGGTRGGSFTEPTSISTGKYIRKRKKTGLIGDCLPGEDCNESVDIPQIEDTVPNDTSGVKDNIDPWVTDKSNVVEALKCDGCGIFPEQIDPRGCCVDNNGTIEFVPYEPIDTRADDEDDPNNCEGCDENEKAFEQDFPKVENILSRHTDEISSMLDKGVTKDKVEYTSTDVKSAAQKLIDAVENKEYKEQTPRKSNIDNTIAGSESSSRDDSSLENINDDYYISDQDIAGGGYKPARKFAPKVKLTKSTTYPDTKDCEGEFLYGDKATTNIALFGTPTLQESPFLKPKSSGVPSKVSPGIDPIYDNSYVHIGATVSGVPIPTDEELPKPLCSNKPWSLVMVKRDSSNATVQAKGAVTSCMLGTVNGKDMIYQRHGLNSRERYSGFIDNDGSRVGRNVDGFYNFWSLDALSGNIPLTGSTFRLEGVFTGHGYRHEMYAEGNEVKEPLVERRVDQRGTTQSINPNSYSAATGDFNITGLTYVPANRAVPIPNTDYTFNNRFSVSTVALALSGNLTGAPQEDKSFIADGYNHSAPIKNGHIWYGSIVRDLPDQYGSIEGIQLIPTGISSNNGSTSAGGAAGDVYLGPHTFVKKGYVSDKVGDTYPTPERERTVCDSPEISVAQDFGLDANKTRLPTDSDITDAKNWANAYGSGAAPLTWEQAADADFTGVDRYYAKVVKTLIYTHGEHKTNPWFRATASGPAKELAQVFVPKIKELYLSAAIDNAPWEDSFLNRFYYEIQQPSKGQLIRKALIKGLVEELFPLLGLSGIISQLDSVGSGVAVFMALPMLIAYWFFMEQIQTSEDYIDNMLGLPKCATDAQGGESDNNLKNFEDNYYDYQNIFNLKNTVNYIQTMPSNYNTCLCKECENTTNDIYFSNLQIPGSPLDAYSNFKALNYTSIGEEKGKLQKLFNFNGDFYFHTTKGLGIFQYSQISTQTSVGSSLLGGSDLLFRPTMFLEGLDEGYGGVSGTNQGQLTPLGYMFVDESARKIYRLTGRGLPIEISALGNERLFQKAINYCGEKTCHDKKSESSTGVSIGFDPYLDNRILITKKDSEDGNSFTVSFDPTANKGQGAFISFHEYIPQHYIWDRHNLFSISDSTIHLHNNEEEYLGFEIDLTATTPFNEYIIESIQTYIESRNGNKRDVDVFFDNLAVYNESQGTGTLDTKLFSDSKGRRENKLAEIIETKEVNVYKKGRAFYQFNAVKDRVVDSCEDRIILIEDNCKIKKELNETIFECKSGEKPGREVFKSDHNNIRLTKNETDTELKLLSINLIKV